MNSGQDSGIKYYATQVSGGEADSHFAVNSVTGAITLIRKLNYKKKDRYVFLVAAIGKLTLIFVVFGFPIVSDCVIS